MKREQITELVKTFMIGKRMRHDDNMINTWAGMIFEKSEKYHYTEASIKRAFDRCLEIQYPDIGDILSCIFTEQDRPTLDEMQKKSVCSQFCAWCRAVTKHDLMFGYYDCAVCGDRYIKERSERVRQVCREKQIGQRTIQPADVDKLVNKLENAVRREF